MSEIECKNFTSSLRFLCGVCINMSSFIDKNYKPYWIRCVINFQSSITTLITEEYELKKIPEKERFLKLKAKFSELYESYREELSEPLRKKMEDGTVKINDEWIRLSEDEPDLFEDVDNKISLGDMRQPLVNSFNTTNNNRGIFIEMTKELVLPLSEMFNFAIVLKKQGINSPNFPLSVIYGIYNLFKYSNPNCDKIIESEILKIYSKLNVSASSVTDKIFKDNPAIEVMLNSNKDMFNIIEDFLEKDLTNDKELTKEVCTQSSKKLRQISKSSKDMKSFMENMFKDGESDKTVDVMEKLKQRMSNVDCFAENITKESINSDHLIMSKPKKGAKILTLSDITK